MPVYAANVTAIEDAVIAKLRLDATADRAKVTSWVNATLCKVAVETRCFTGSTAGSALAAAATSQALPAAIIELEYITAAYGGQSVLLREAPSYERILAARQQPGASGPPWSYYLRNGTVELWPAAAGGEILTYHGANMPSSIATTETAPAPMVEPFSKLLEFGALVEGAEFKKDPLLGEFQQQYASWFGRFQAFLNRRGGAYPAAFQVRGTETNFVPRDPSADWNSTNPWL